VQQPCVPRSLQSRTLFTPALTSHTPSSQAPTAKQDPQSAEGKASDREIGISESMVSEVCVPLCH